MGNAYKNMKQAFLVALIAVIFMFAFMLSENADSTDTRACVLIDSGTFGQDKKTGLPVFLIKPCEGKGFYRFELQPKQKVNL